MKTLGREHRGDGGRPVMTRREQRGPSRHTHASGTGGSPSLPTAHHIRVAIGDNQVIYRHGVRTALAPARDLQLVAEASSLDEVAQAVRHLQPDILLLEPSLLSSVREGVAQLRAASPRLRILLLTDSDLGDDFVEHLKAGTFGYLAKSLSADELIRAIRRAHQGQAAVAAPLVGRLVAEVHRLAVRQDADHAVQGSRLTSREADVLRLIGLGRSNREIGRELSLSEHTVKNHVRAVFKKLGVRTRTSAAMVAFRQGLH